MVCQFLCSLRGLPEDCPNCECSVTGYVCLSFLVAQLPLLWVLWKLCLAVWARVRPRVDLVRLYQPGSWVVITGGTAGIGLAYAFRFAELGFDLALVARDERKLERVKSFITYKYPEIRVHTIQADFSRPVRTMLGGRVFSIYTAIAAHLQNLDVAVLVNNVGMCTDIHYSHSLGAAQMNAILTVNLESQLKMSKMVAQKMIRQGHRAAIINVASHAGVLPAPLLAAYSASKAFNRFYSLALWQEYKDMGIQVLAVTPAFVDTQLQGWIAETMNTEVGPAAGESGDLAALGTPTTEAAEAEEKQATSLSTTQQQRRPAARRSRLMRWPRVTPMQVVDGSLAELGRGTRETSGAGWHKLIIGVLRMVPQWIYLDFAKDYLIDIQKRYIRSMTNRLPVPHNPTEAELQRYQALQRKQQSRSTGGGRSQGSRREGLWDEDEDLDDLEEYDSAQHLMGDFHFDSEALLFNSLGARGEADGGGDQPAVVPAFASLGGGTDVDGESSGSEDGGAGVVVDDLDSIEMRFRDQQL